MEILKRKSYIVLKDSSGYTFGTVRVDDMGLLLSVGKNNPNPSWRAWNGPYKYRFPAIDLLDDHLWDVFNLSITQEIEDHLNKLMMMQKLVSNF